MHALFFDNIGDNDFAGSRSRVDFNRTEIAQLVYKRRMSATSLYGWPGLTVNLERTELIAKCALQGP